MFRRVVLHMATIRAVMFLLGIIFSLRYLIDVIPNLAVAAFGIRGGKRGWLGPFASHPPLEDRIAHYAAPAPYYRGH